MVPFLEVAKTGVAAVRLHPLRSLVTVACVVAVLLPYLVGLGLSRGLREEADTAIRCGADLYVTATEFGRPVPIPAAAAAEVRHIDGVTDVVQRIVGTLTIGTDRESAVVVGLPPDHFPASVACIEGSLPADGSLNELVVGTELARRLGLHVGSMLPYFYYNVHGERLSRVVGIFRSDVSLWQARLIFTTFDTASTIFNQQGLATDLLVSCRPGYEERVAAAVVRALTLPAGPSGGNVRPRVMAREDVAVLLPQGLQHREGVFTLHFLLAFAVGIPLVPVTSGVGLAERRREVGILKATGWQTDEVLLRGLVESLLLSVAGAALAVLLAFGWLRGLNGYGIAGVFLPGTGWTPSFRVPFRLMPVPVLLAFLISFAVVLSGTLYSSWRAATVPPREALR